MYAHYKHHVIETSYEICISDVFKISDSLNKSKCWFVSARAESMRIVAGDYSVGLYEGTEQFLRPHLLIPHPEYDKDTNNADIMLIKVRQNQCYPVTLSNSLKRHYSRDSLIPVTHKK